MQAQKFRPAPEPGFVSDVFDQSRGRGAIAPREQPKSRVRQRKLSAKERQLLEAQPGENLLDTRLGQRTDPLAEARLFER